MQLSEMQENRKQALWKYVYNFGRRVVRRFHHLLALMPCRSARITLRNADHTH